VGEFFGAWRAWDAVRGLDYLLSRPEVDPRRVGVTGNSGGGTMTTWLCGLDERITMAAPGCFVTTLLANMENELPADVEQIPPRLIEFGLDECDFFIPFAPKPLILLAQERDYFDLRGSQEAYRELRRIYAILGADKNIWMKVGSGPHGYSRELREAMYAFFGQHAGVRISPREPRLRMENQETLFASRTGVLLREGSKRVFDFTRTRADELLAKRKPLGGRNLKDALATMLVLPKRAGPPHYRILPPYHAGKSRFQNFALETEPGIQGMVTMPNPDPERQRVPRGSRCNLLVPHLAAWDDLRSSKVRRLLGERTRTFAVDPRGIGRSMSASCENLGFFAPYDSDYFYNAYALMLGEPYVGRRVHDVLSTLDWLFAHGYREIHVIGRGMGAVLALLACTLDDRPAKVTLINGLLSFHELTRVPIYRWPASSMLRDVLGKFDLPDCYRAVGGKLKVIEPWDAQMRPLERVEARRRLKDMGVSSR
jgi:dienelactone hydrolase